MAADTAHYSVNSSIIAKNDGAFCNSDCQGCTLMKSEVQALEKEVKSMTEIINILRDELKYNCAYKDESELSSTYAEKLKSSSNQCCKCVQLESQLQVALNELSSVKLITHILSEECKSLEQISHVDPNADNLRSGVKPYNPQPTTATRPPDPMHSSLGASNFCKYTVPTSNRYAVLSNHLELQQLHISKMADNPLNAVANSPIKINSNSVLSINNPQCCSLLKNNVQALENEVKSMTVIINILMYQVWRNLCQATLVSLHF